MAVQIQWRRDTAANWTAADPTLAEGEAGYETDTGKLKLGDGLLPWSLLAYYSAGATGLGLSAGTQSVATGTVVFSNSNGISFGMSGSSRVTASYTVPSTAGLISAINVSGGTTSNNLSALTFSDGGNVSFGLNGSVITASAPAGGGALSVGMSTIGNTSGDTGLVESRLVLAGGNNITLSGNTGVLNRMTITVSGPNVVLPSAGTQTAASGTVVFANSNGITFGMSGSSQITASHNGLTTQSAQAFSADASSTFQTLSFQDSNGVSFSNNAGALRITHGLQFTSATSAITSNALNTSASRVINIVAATNNTAGGTASLSSNVSFSAANGITFYTSAGNAIVASHNALTTARASTDAIGLNTAQTNVTWTVNSSGLSFNAAGYAGTTTAITGNALLTLNSLGLRLDGSGLAGTSTGFTGANISASMTHNSAGLAMSMSVAAPGGGGGVGLSAGTQSVSTGTVVFSNSNGITFGMSGSSQVTASYNSTQFAGTGTTFAGANASGSMTLNSNGLNLSVSVAAPGAAAEQNAINLLGANTAGNTTATGSTIGMSGLNLTLSGTNASQIVISAPATSSLVADGGLSISTNGSTITLSQIPVVYRDWDNMRVIQSMNLISNITETAFSRGRPLLIPMDVDGHLVWNKAMIEMSRSTSGSNAFTVGLGIYSFVNSSQLSLMGSLTNAFSASNTASVSGIRRFELSGIGTGASSLTPGHYMAALMFSANGDNTLSMNYSIRGGLTANPPVGLIRPGSDSNVTANLSSIALRHFRGFWSATTANPPDTIGLTQMSMWTTGGHPYLWLGSN